MGKIKCLCKFKDKQFQNALSILLLSSGYFTLVDDLESEAGGMEKMILITENTSYNFEKHQDICKVILDEDLSPDDEGRLEGGILTLYRYNGFDILLKRINEAFELSMMRRRTGGIDEISIVGITSVSGGVGATTIAKSVGKIVKREGDNPLYLSLSPINPGVKERDMTRLLYDLKRGRSIDLSLYISSFDGLDTIATTEINPYAHLIDKDVILKIAEAAKACNYNILILDIGNHLEEKNRAVLEIANYEIMLLPLNRDILRNGHSMVDSYSDINSCPTFTLINNNNNCSWGEYSEESFLEDIPSDGYIPYLGEITERSIDTELGNEIRFLLNKIGENIGT